MRGWSTWLTVLLCGVLPAVPARAGEPRLEKADLFEAGKGGHKLYRIPGIVVTAKGTVLAYCEARRHTGLDWDDIEILLRRSTDGGATWSLVDRFDMPTPGSARPTAVTGDANGNVYVTGMTLERVAIGSRKGITTYGTTERWVTRRGVIGSGGSLAWSQVDSQPSTGWGNTAVPDAAVDGSGNAYVIASVSDGTNSASVVRSNVGGIWQTVDHFQLAAGKNSSGRALAVDAAGNVFAGGGGFDANGVAHWIVRSPAAAATTAPTFSATTIGFDDATPHEQTLVEEVLAATA